MQRIKSIKIPIHRPWIPYIILVISLLLTCLSTLYVNRTVRNQESLRFQNLIQQVENEIDNRLEADTALLRGGAALFTIDQDVTAADFNEFVTRLQFVDIYADIQSFGFAQRIATDDRDTFTETQRAEYLEEYTIHPDTNLRDSYPVVYLQPQEESNQTAIGFDMYTNPVRKEAMDQARDMGKSTTSGRVNLIQEISEKRQPGFVIFTPVYTESTIPKTVEERREKISGFVYGAFNANDFLQSVFGDPDLPLINYQVYDGRGTDPKNLLYDSVPKEATSQVKRYKPQFTETKELQMAGQNWTIVFSTQPNFEDSLQSILTPFIFIGGILVSLTLFLLSRAEYLARSKAEQSALELQISQKQLQKAIGLRDNFISIASHELKTPVTSIKVYGEVLLRKFTQKKDVKTADYLSKMNRQIDKLTILIQDLLDVSRLQAGRLALREENFDMNELIQEVVESTQQLLDNHKIIIKHKAKNMVTGDRDRIGQVISNLLTNAIKYSPKADKVIIRIKETKETITVSVQDFGIGIDKRHQDKVFSRFYRVSDTDERTYPGLGIGLFICNEIIHRHNGTISIKSAKHKGSTFSFTIPFKHE